MTLKNRIENINVIYFTRKITIVENKFVQFSHRGSLQRQMLGGIIQPDGMFMFYSPLIRSFSIDSFQC